MRVLDVNSPMPEIRSGSALEEKHASEDVSRLFRRELTDITRSAHAERIQKMCQDIFAQGEVVAKRADIKELQRYRSMIQELIGETVSGGFEFSKAGSFDARGRHRVFATINKVNSTLDELTSELLKEEADKIEVLHKVDDIRGLLVDLFL